MELNEGWQYRRGDSPTDSNGNLVWLKDSLNSPEWTAVNNLSNISFDEPTQSLWLRLQLPDCQCKSPGIFVGIVERAMQVYLDDKLIYQFGDFNDINGYHFQGWRHHLIPFPENFENRLLTFRIWSDGPSVGVEMPVLLGSVFDIQRDLFLGDLDDIILGSLFLISTTILILLFFFFRRDWLFIKLALYLAAIALFTISNSTLLLITINAPYLIFLIDTLSLFTLPVAGYLLIENVILKKYKTIIRRFWQIQLLYLVISIIILQLPGQMYIYELLYLFLIISTILMMVCAVLIYMSRGQVGNEIKILLAGIIIFFVSISIEIILFFYTSLQSGETFRLNLLHYGALCFVASLIWVTIYRYIETNRQKIAAQEKNMEFTIQNERLKNQMIRKKLETEKWLELDKFKSRFLTNISHEFRTPLTLILGTARQLINESHNELMTERLRMQEKNGLRLLSQVNQLLDLSKLDAGKMNLQAEENDFIPLVKGIFYSFESLARQKDVELIFKTGIDSAKIFYDKNKMETILSNLFSNALKFTNAGGNVEVTVSQNEWLTLNVADTGIGISNKDLPHIFNRFYQAGDSNATGRQGSGIGLSLTHELVKLHHGEITVTSEENKGTLFTLRLPLGKEHLKKDEIVNVENKTVKEPGNETAKEILDAAISQDLPGINSDVHQTDSHIPSSDSCAQRPILLIVEDNEDMRAYIKEELIDIYQFEEAVDGEEGFQKAVQNIPDLIISDVMMPKMDGYRLCEKLKTDELTSHIPVVLLTAKSGKESKIEGLEHGADDYLIKPFESDELKARVKNLIEQRGKLRLRFAREITISFKEIAVTSADEKFLDRAVKIIESRLDDPEVSVEWFCKEMGLSHSQIHRKFHALTCQSISEFIRSVRLKHAVLLLEKKSATISEIAFQTGFSSPDYFRSCFKQQFGCSPSSYISEL